MIRPSAYVDVWAGLALTGDKYAKVVYDCKDSLADANEKESSRTPALDDDDQYFERPIQLQYPTAAWFDK